MIYNGFDFAPWFDTRLVTRSLLPLSLIHI